MKQFKTEFFPSKLVRFSKQIPYADILAPVRDNPSQFSLRGRPEYHLKYQLPNPGYQKPCDYIFLKQMSIVHKIQNCECKKLQIFSDSKMRINQLQNILLDMLKMVNSPITYVAMCLLFGGLSGQNSGALEAAQRQGGFP